MEKSNTIVYTKAPVKKLEKGKKYKVKAGNGKPSAKSRMMAVVRSCSTCG